MSETTWNMTNVNDTIVGEVLPVFIPFEVKGFLVITLGKALKKSCDYVQLAKKGWQPRIIACNPCGLPWSKRLALGCVISVLQPGCGVT